MPDLTEAETIVSLGSRRCENPSADCRAGAAKALDSCRLSEGGIPAPVAEASTPVAIRKSDSGLRLRKRPAT